MLESLFSLIPFAEICDTSCPRHPTPCHVQIRPRPWRLDWTIRTPSTLRLSSSEALFFLFLIDLFSLICFNEGYCVFDYILLIYSFNQRLYMKECVQFGSSIINVLHFLHIVLLKFFFSARRDSWVHIYIKCLHVKHLASMHLHSNIYFLVFLVHLHCLFSY